MCARHNTQAVVGWASKSRPASNQHLIKDAVVSWV